MKIVFVSKIRMPENRGVSFAIANMCQALAENGNEVELILPNRPLKDNYKELDFWQYYQIKKNAFLIRKLFCFNLPLFHLQEIIMSWSFSLGLVFFLKKNNFLTVHLFGECKEALVLLKVFSWLYHPIIVYESHITPVGWYEQFLELLGISRVNLLVTSNRYLASFYKSKYMFRNKVIVAPNGINLKDFDYKTTKSILRKKLKLPTDKMIIGFGGRFVTNNMEKGVPDLINAVALLSKSNESYYLCCVGGPQEYVVKYIEMAKKVGLNENQFMFKAHVPPNILYQYMRAFDICTMPFPENHHFSHIMAPLKMFEYLASKNPIVATDLPAVREILVHSKTALLAKPGNYKDLARNIELLVCDKKLGEKLSEAAFLLVTKTHTWEKRQAAIIAAIAN